LRAQGRCMGLKVVKSRFFEANSYSLVQTHAQRHGQTEGQTDYHALADHTACKAYSSRIG